ncbi:RidA family protein [Rhodococcus sp. IEGM 1409]|uniref:RidA family protein n=1 Tax=Rhodococcus sp. IEGM 1409 TaxID=3047082 RepID=UPI0024B6EB50|nr:RidA family protein [Rhodococcus sp. IEGM 1409]MDI9901673.1 RidA family protein [Rhodococcus sp. IEGM 1409]
MGTMITDTSGRRYLNRGDAKGPFLTAIESNHTLYISGQGGFISDGTIPEGIRDQTKATLENVRRIIEDCGWSVSDLVQITCYLADIEEWGTMNSEYEKFFANQPLPPTRTAIGVAALPFGLRVEMTCTASRDADR